MKGLYASSAIRVEKAWKGFKRSSESGHLTLALTALLVILIIASLRQTSSSLGMAFGRSGGRGVMRMDTSSHFYEVSYYEAKRTNRSEVNIAFFIQVSESTVHLLPRLLMRIHHPENHYAIHFDAKIDAAVVKKATDNLIEGTGFSNIYFLTRELVTYRGISMVTNTLSAIENLLEGGKDWEYFINLSASDYPLVTPKKLRELLAYSEDGLLFFEDLSNRLGHFFKSRVGTIHADPAVFFGQQSTDLFSTYNKGLKWWENPFVNSRIDFEYFKVEAWMMISRDFARYSVYGSFPRKILVWLANTPSSPEHFFIIAAGGHAKFKERVIPDGFRLVVWSDGAKTPLQHPLDLDASKHGMDHFWTNIQESEDLFARKFTIANSSLMDKIDKSCAGLVGPGEEPSLDAKKFHESIWKKLRNLVDNHHF